MERPRLTHKEILRHATQGYLFQHYFGTDIQTGEKVSIRTSQNARVYNIEIFKGCMLRPIQQIYGRSEARAEAIGQIPESLLYVIASDYQIYL